MSDHPHLIRPLIDVLDQGARLIAGLAERPDAREFYVRVPEPLSTAGLGAHFRHCLDFVRALVNGLPTGRIDYDARERDIAIENDPQVALAELEDLKAKVISLARKGLALETELCVRMDAPPAASAAEPDGAPDEVCWVRSSVGREFNLVMSHTIHHYALIAMTLRHCGEDPGPEFGVAPATLSYWREEGRCAPLVG